MIKDILYYNNGHFKRDERPNWVVQVHDNALYSELDGLYTNSVVCAFEHG